MMKIRWMGHSCFEIQSETGRTIVTDPFDESVGYKAGFSGDIVLVSHDHFDHNAVDMVSVPRGSQRGEPRVIKGPGEHREDGLVFKGVSSFHDDRAGSERGSNTIFVMALDGIRLCHLGDLGHVLNQDQVNEIGQVDVLLVPVGGRYTIDAGQADTVISQLNPRVVIPMHYKTDVLDFPISGVDEFTAGKDNVVSTGRQEVEIDRDSLPETRQIILLEYE